MERVQERCSSNLPSEIAQSPSISSPPVYTRSILLGVVDSQLSLPRRVVVSMSRGSSFPLTTAAHARGNGNVAAEVRRTILPTTVGSLNSNDRICFQQDNNPFVQLLPST